MRTIITHRTENSQRELSLAVTGSGDKDAESPPSYVVGNFVDRRTGRPASLVVEFDDGADQHTLRGVTDEVLLAIVLDRLEQAQRLRPTESRGLALAAARHSLNCLRADREKLARQSAR